VSEAHCVAPHECAPSHAEKHLKVDPSGAQSESLEQGREQDFAMGVQPASVNEPSGSHERPAAHSPSVVQEMPAGRSELPLLLHAATADSPPNRRGKAKRVTAKG
jgi:hypothetical protein